MSDPLGTWRIRLFALLLLTSGLCGISYEVLYARILGDLIGDQFAVSASILLTFLLGIGLGSYNAHRLWRHLWLVEAAIGLYGALFVLGAPLLDVFIYSNLPLARAGLAGSVALGVLLLLIPAFLIGTGLPIFAGYLSRMQSGLVFARAYSLYNLGAAATVLGIEFGLIRALGIRHATLCIAALNALVALGLITVFRRLRRQRPVVPESDAVHWPRSQLAALATASVGSAVFQLLMIKLAEAVLGPFRETFALVLSLILAGIAIGSALTQRFRLSFSKLMALNLLGLVWSIGTFGGAAELYALFHPILGESYLASLALKLGFLVWVMGLPAMTFGATIPALVKSQHNVAKESGQLLLVSSLANAFGFLLMVFYLHQHFDYGTLLLVIAMLSAIALAIQRFRFDLRMATVAALLLVAGISHRGVWDENLLYIGHTSFDSLDELMETRNDFRSSQTFKGPQDVFSITWFEDTPSFIINGYTSISLDSPYERVVGALSSVFAPRADRALVLGVGSGGTASVVGELFDRTDAVEINKVVLDNLFRMKDYNFDIENNPKVTIVHDDGIHYVKASETQYSLILNTVTTPLYFSSSKLYTREFLESIRKRLTPDGIYVTWVDGRMGVRGVEIVLSTVDRSFEHCVLGYVKAAYYLLICSQEPVKAHQPRIVADHPVVGPVLLEEFGIRPEWIPYALLHTHPAELIGDRPAPVNTLDYPVLEFEMARLRTLGIQEFLLTLRDGMRLADVEAVLGQSMDFNPLHLAVQAHIILRDSSLTDQWKKLAGEELEDFETQFHQANTTHRQEVAALADTADAHHELGYSLLKAERYEEAIAAFRSALERDPMRVNSNYNIGASYEFLEKYPEALMGYRAELGLDTGDESTRYRIARVYVKMGRFEEGLNALDVLARGNESSSLQYFRGQALEGLGRVPEARRAYREALTIDPENERASEALDQLVSAAKQVSQEGSQRTAP